MQWGDRDKERKGATERFNYRGFKKGKYAQKMETIRKKKRQNIQKPTKIELLERD